MIRVKIVDVSHWRYHQQNSTLNSKHILNFHLKPSNKIQIPYLACCMNRECYADLCGYNDLQFYSVFRRFSHHQFANLANGSNPCVWNQIPKNTQHIRMLPSEHIRHDEYLVTSSRQNGMQR